MSLCSLRLLMSLWGKLLVPTLTRGRSVLRHIVSCLFRNYAQEPSTLGCLKTQYARNMCWHQVLPPVLACISVLADFESKLVVFYQCLFSDGFHQLPSQKGSKHNENLSLSEQCQLVYHLPRPKLLDCYFLSSLPCICDLQLVYVHPELMIEAIQ